MSEELVRYLAVGAAAIGVVSTVLFYVFKWKEIRLLRDIRDRLDHDGDRPKP